MIFAGALDRRANRRFRGYRATAVAALSLAWALAPAVATATGSNIPTMGTTIRNASGQVIAQAQWNRTAYHIHVVISGTVGTPTGKVNIAAWSNGTCAGGSAALPVLTLVNGVADSADYLGSAIGAVSYRATYSGDGTYASRTGGCKQLTIIKQKPVVTSKVRDSGGTAGTVFRTGETVHDSGAVTGVNATPTDIVYVDSFSDATCTTKVGLTLAASLTNGKFDNAAPRSFTKPGTRSYRVTYPGDTHFQTATGPCEPFTIKAPSTTSTQVFNGSTPDTTILIGTGKVTDHITVSGSFGVPTGSVFAQLFDNGTCSGMPMYESQHVTLSAGKAELTAFGPTRTPDPGAYSLKAFYLGNGTYLKNSGACEPFNMLKSNVSVGSIGLTAGSHNVTSLVVGQSAYPYVAFDVPVGMAGPTGTVTVVFLGAGCQGVGVAKSAQIVDGVAKITSAVITPTTTDSIWLSFGYSGDALYKKAGLGCVEVPVSAATPAPGATSPPLVVTTPAPDATEAPAETAAPSGEPAASPSAAATALASAATGSPAASSPVGSSAGPGPSAAPVSTDAGSGSSIPWLLIVAIVAIVLLVGFEATRQRRRSNPAP